MDQRICFRPGASPGPTSGRSPAEFHELPNAAATAPIRACGGSFPVLYGVGLAGSMVVERFVRELDGHFPSADLAVMAAPVPRRGRRSRCQDPLSVFSKRVTAIWFVGRLGESDFDLLSCLAERWAVLGAEIRLLALLPEDATMDDWDRALAQLDAITKRHN